MSEVPLGYRPPRPQDIWLPNSLYVVVYRPLVDFTERDLDSPATETAQERRWPSVPNGEFRSTTLPWSLDPPQLLPPTQDSQESRFALFIPRNAEGTDGDFFIHSYDVVDDYFGHVKNMHFVEMHRAGFDDFELRGRQILPQPHGVAWLAGAISETDRYRIRTQRFSLGEYDFDDAAWLKRVLCLLQLVQPEPIVDAAFRQLYTNEELLVHYLEWNSNRWFEGDFIDCSPYLRAVPLPVRRARMSAIGSTGLRE